MRAFQEDDFKKMARDVVAEYLERETPLSDGLAKAAEDMELNPDQIQNLVQLANSLAHLTLFENKNDGDKIVEFKPADPDDVLKRVYKEDSVPESAESEEVCEMPSSSSKEMDFFGDFPDIASKLKSILSGGSESICDPEEEKAESSVSPERRSMMVIRIRKVASELKNREMTSALEYQEELDKLASEFAKLYGPDFSDFEKNAVAFRGDTAIPVLADIRSCLRIAGQVNTDSFEKRACVVDTETREMKSLDRLIKLAESHRDHGRAYTYLRQKVGGIL